MKKFSLFALAAAGLLFGACTNDNEIQGVANNRYNLVEGESSWLAIGISMPGDAITRANEDLTDGLPTEYDVKSGTLYLFKGTSEDEAVYFESYTIPTKFNNETTDNVPEGNNQGTNSNGFGEITSTSTKMVQEITNPKLGGDDNLYAYVILNDDKNVTFENLQKNTTTGAQFKKMQLKAIGIADETKGFGAIGANGLVMTNVPIATAEGGVSSPENADILTFTQINKDAIYDTKAKAMADGAQMACIYVERAAAKVEVKLAETGFGIQLDGDDFITIPASKVKWALGNVNYGGDATGAQGYYNTRQMQKAWLPYNNLKASPTYLKWRMVGRTRFFDENHTPNPAYRTYFAEDPNYVGTQPTTHWEDGVEVTGYNGYDGYIANTGLLNAQLQDAQYTLDPGGVTYTYENTFDENSQIFSNTTYVGVKVDINNGVAFYTMEGQPNTKLADVNKIKDVLTIRLRDNINQRRMNIKAAITEDLNKTTGRTIPTGVTSCSWDFTINVALTDYTESTGEQSYTITLGMTNIQTTKDDGTSGAATTAEEAAITALAKPYLSDYTNGTIENPANSKVYKYVDGYAYYAERIMHFGDIETPWSAPAEAYDIYQDATKPSIYPANATQTIDGVTTVYGENYANAWLGRWGVVRNNWYELTLKKIEGIGSPVPEDFSGEAGITPDDNPNTLYFISAEIHILPWVKRTQEVNF